METGFLDNRQLAVRPLLWRSWQGAYHLRDDHPNRAREARATVSGELVVGRW